MVREQGATQTLGGAQQADLFCLLPPKNEILPFKLVLLPPKV